VSQGTCGYIRMYVNAVANNVMLLLHLGHDSYDNFKIKHTLYIYTDIDIDLASGSSPLTPSEKFWVPTSIKKTSAYCV
jgi:hypothetical protein